ncbi:hypothetical protein JCM4914_62040 [Streptomyces platensis subsp. malvinus]
MKGYSPLQTGFAIVPLAFGMRVVTRYGMRWAHRAGEAGAVGAGRWVRGWGSPWPGPCCRCGAAGHPAA